MSNPGQRRADKERRRRNRKNKHPNVNHIKIVTGGRKIPGLPFMGEEMTCCMCGKTEKSDPAVETNWRVVEPDGVRYYVCADHFPPDETGTAEQFQIAYLAVFNKIMAGMLP